MPNYTSQVTSYRDNTTTYSVQPFVPQKRAIADLISFIDPTDVPLLRALGIGERGADGMDKVRQFRIVNWPSTRVEWLEDEYMRVQTTLQTALAATNAVVTAVITVGHPFVLRPGMRVKVDGENMLVTAVNSNSATVTRMFGGTATNVNQSGSHAIGAPVDIIGYSRQEGAESDAGNFTQPVAPFNFTSIYQDEIKVSRSAGQMTRYGISDEYNYQLSKRFPELLRLMERDVLWNTVRNAGDASAGNPRTMGGLPVFVSVNTVSLGNTALTQTVLENMIQSCWAAGGQPDLIVCGGWVKRKITSFYTNSVRTTRSERRGGVVIDTVVTEFGELDVLLTRHIKPTELYVLDTRHVGILPFTPFTDEPLAKTGDYERGQIVGEYTLVVRHAAAHARILDISTTS
jgi:hypothetical protein